MQAYEAYVENGQIYPVGKISRNPKRVRAIVTILDEPTQGKSNNQKGKALWEEVRELYGIVRSDIDEKVELAEARDEKYADFS